MFKVFVKRLNIKPIDLVPAISGLIGKIALVSSFAFVWAQELNIIEPNFVFANVRTEVVIGCLITLICAYFLPDTAPAGTLAPLIVLIPYMARAGVHPLILSFMVGIMGIIFVKTKVFRKLILVSGHISKTGLSLVFGISGVLLTAEKLYAFFGSRFVPLFLIIFILTVTYAVLLKYRKIWLMIPAAAIVSLTVPMFFGIKIDVSAAAGTLNFNPDFWWNDMWGIGFGLNAMNIIKTIPFALFVILLWTIDTVSLNAIIDANFTIEEKKEEFNLEKSFLIVSIRNIIGGLFGGAQTASLWRSFLIPLFIIKRPMRPAAILLGVIGLAAGLTGTPIKLLSFPPLIWTVLLFGIFVPFIMIGLKNIKSTKNISQIIAIAVFTLTGILFNPIFTWIGSVCYEKLNNIQTMNKLTEN